MKFVKCRNRIVSGKLDAVASTKDSWCTVTRNHELTQKYKHVQFYPILFIVSKTHHWLSKLPQFPPCYLMWSVGGVDGGTEGYCPTQNKRSGQESPDTLPPCKAWTLVSNLDAARPPAMHPWNGFFCDLVPINHVKLTQQFRTNSLLCPPPHFSQFLRA